MTQAIYLDYQATTPCDPRVVEAMQPYWGVHFGNPHSRSHVYGWDAEKATEQARERVASLIGAESKDIIFTSGATESNNLAIKGAAGFYPNKKHIITVATEHKCVLESCRQLAQEGYTVTYLPVDAHGIISLDELKKAIRPDTLLVSIMVVNNEIGVIQPISEIGKICRSSGVLFHTDAAQAVGKLPIDVHAMCIDMLSISAHKMYGPKGVGALYVGRKPRVRLKGLISGGGQERGMRSGTLCPALCVGFGEAARIALECMSDEAEHIQKLHNRLWQGLSARLTHITLNGHHTQRWPGNLNVSFDHVEGEGLMMGMKNICVSSGSACTSSSLEPSYVLRALGIDEGSAHTSIRMGIGRFTTEAEIDEAIEAISKAVIRLRDMSPLWDMAQAGIDISAIQWVGH